MALNLVPLHTTVRPSALWQHGCNCVCPPLLLRPLCSLPAGAPPAAASEKASDAQLPEPALPFKALFTFSVQEEFRCQLGDSNILMKRVPKLKGTGKYPTKKKATEG